jgi:hypothetical protein
MPCVTRLNGLMSGDGTLESEPEAGETEPADMGVSGLSAGGRVEEYGGCGEAEMPLDDVDLLDAGERRSGS